MVDKGLEVVRATVAIIDVIGVLPNIAPQNGLRALHQGAFTIGGLRDDDLSVLDRQPAPARTELGDTGLDEILFHFGDRPQVRNDLLFQIAGNLVAAAALLHPLPEMSVVVVLAGIIEQTRVLAER